MKEKQRRGETPDLVPFSDEGNGVASFDFRKAVDGKHLRRQDDRNEMTNQEPELSSDTGSPREGAVLDTGARALKGAAPVELEFQGKAMNLPKNIAADVGFLRQASPSSHPHPAAVSFRCCPLRTSNLHYV